jgi:hypothetical protein
MDHIRYLPFVMTVEVPTRFFFRRPMWWQMATVLAGWAAIIGCETPPAQRASTTKPRPSRGFLTAADTVAPPTASQRGYHRYRGTLAGRPVQLELTMVPNAPYNHPVGGVDEQGLFRYLDSGKVLPMGRSYGVAASQPLEFEEWVHNSLETAFCTDQPVGALLTGTHTLSGRSMPFRMQEDYSDCLRYEVLHEKTTGPLVSRGEEMVRASVEQDYLHLLGPDTLQPARSRLQCPVPAQRQQARQVLTQRLEAGVHRRHFIDLHLNEADLLAYRLEEREEYTRSRYYESSIRQVLFDLRTGQQLHLGSQLRPGGLRRLHQLLIRQAMADTMYARHRDYWRQEGILPLPTGGFAVTPKGLVASYQEHESEPDMYGYSQTIAWTDLRPLLRPGSPLQRLLKTPGR